MIGMYIKECLRGLFNCLFKLFDYFWMKGLTGMKWNDHADVVFEIYAVTAFAAHQLKTCFKQELFRFGSGQSRQIRQCTPQGLR